MALKAFSMRQLAYLVEEIQWSLSSGGVDKGRVKRGNKAPLVRGSIALQKSSIPKVLNKRRLVRLLPWAGVGTVVAVMDPTVTMAILAGGTLGWWVWQGQGGETPGIVNDLKVQVERLNLRPEQRQLGVAVASGGVIAIAAYGGLALWNSFHNPWLVAGVVGQSALTLAMVLTLLKQRETRQQEEQISRFVHLLDRLLISPSHQRPVVIQELFWLALNGRLDTYQQGMVLQALQSLFIGVDNSAEKSQISAAIARFQQIQHSIPVNAKGGRQNVRALSGTTLDNIHMPLGNNVSRQWEQVAQADDQVRSLSGQPVKNSRVNPLNLTKNPRKASS
ncbi:MAG: hypothetical protein ACFCA4_04335 [Cyanophyceae cyanobacterium]